MGILDTLKETADLVASKAADLASTGVAQSRRLAEIAKLKTANVGEEDTIKKAYIELGKLYYAEQGAAPEGAYAAACEKVTAAKAAIEANNARIAELKAELAETSNAGSVTEVEELVEEAAEEAAKEVLAEAEAEAPAEEAAEEAVAEAEAEAPVEAVEDAAEEAEIAEAVEEAAEEVAEVVEDAVEDAEDAEKAAEESEEPKE